MQSKLQIILDNLGTTKTQIARYLEKIGVKGKKGATEDCVLSEYIKKSLEVSFVSVDDEMVTITDKDGIDYTVKTSKPLRRFIYSFDEGKYKRLVNA